ncbi:hypothetical protein CANARDRAFT_29388 [[Candida] arabinofermentans NRRL YB-2248]|uniref:Uncharacterized protein n=1 Tax=[Candida] arabinofermentans NRRL YB-2248 TaxID=983967 RepID=A0A1E4SXN1_9ASCO|nr:hypothetical protein CANARDRAFT_29388 [[Candida] arabinofermentans NRRL YB-2248]
MSAVVEGTSLTMEEHPNQIDAESPKGNTSEIPQRSSSLADHDEFELPKTTKTYAHLQQYPIAASWMKIGHAVPMPHFFRTFLFRLAYSRFVRNFTEAADSFADQRLTNLETRVPQVKTLRMRDIRNRMTDPISKSALYVDDRMHNLSVSVHERVVDPVRNRVSTARRARTALSAESGVNFVSRQIDPLIKPINERLYETIEKRYEGEGTPLPTDANFPSELSRTVSILNNGYARGRPVLERRVNNMRELPSKASKRMSEVYQENRAKRGDGRMVVMIASLDTVRDLTNEGYTVINQPSEDTPITKQSAPAETTMAEPEVVI